MGSDMDLVESLYRGEPEGSTQGRRRGCRSCDPPAARRPGDPAPSAPRRTCRRASPPVSSSTETHPQIAPGTLSMHPGAPPCADRDVERVPSPDLDSPYAPGDPRPGLRQSAVGGVCLAPAHRLP